MVTNKISQDATIRNPVYNSVDELAAELQLSRSIVYRGLRDGTIPSLRVGKRFILPKAAISEWLRNAGGGRIA